MRIEEGEILALRYEDVDLSCEGTIRVERTLHEGECSSPKTSSSRRTLTLPQKALEALSRLCEVNSNPSGDLFATSTGKPVDVSNFYKWTWKPALRRAGLPETLTPALSQTRYGITATQSERTRTSSEQVSRTRQPRRYYESVCSCYRRYKRSSSRRYRRRTKIDSGAEVLGLGYPRSPIVLRRCPESVATSTRYQVASGLGVATSIDFPPRGEPPSSLCASFSSRRCLSTGGYRWLSTSIAY